MNIQSPDSKSDKKSRDQKAHQILAVNASGEVVGVAELQEDIEIDKIRVSSGRAEKILKSRDIDVVVVGTAESTKKDEVLYTATFEVGNITPPLQKNSLDVTTKNSLRHSNQQPTEREHVSNNEQNKYPDTTKGQRLRVKGGKLVRTQISLIPTIKDVLNQLAEQKETSVSLIVNEKLENDPEIRSLIELAHK